MAGAGWRRDFRCLWAGQSVSLLGSEVTGLALPLTAVLTLHASAGQLGLLGAAAYLPYLLLSLPAGVWVDRRRRLPILILTSLGQMTAVAAVPVLAALAALNVYALLAAAFCSGVCRVGFDLAYHAYLPSLVPLEALTEANSRLAASESVAEIGGPGLGGALSQLLGAPYALLVDAASFLVCSLGLAAIRTREVAPTRSPDKGRRQAVAGIRFTFSQPYLRAFAGEAASYNLCWQIVQTVLVAFAVRQLHLRPATLGLVLGVGAVGALMGALGTPRTAQRFGIGRTLVWAAVIGDTAPLALPLAHPGAFAVPLLAAAFFVRGIGVSGCNVHVSAIRQTVIPLHLLGRANAAYRLLVTGVIPVGALAGGWLGDTLGLRPTIAVGTLGLLSTSLFLVLSPVRQARVLGDCVPDPAIRFPRPTAG